jgi:hypothetical protein
MVNYQDGRIYKIVCNVTNLIYIGSTCKKLCERMTKHRQNFKQYQNGKHNFITSFKVLENGNFDIVLLENYPCDSKEQLHARERFYIETMNCVNKFIPTRTNKEYYDDNKIRISEAYKEYYDGNKIRISEQHKQYRKDNKELISLLNKKKNICDCGKEYTVGHKSRHLKSKRHMKHQELQNQTVEIKIEQQIIEKQDDVMIDRPQMNDLYMCSCGALCSLNSRFWHLKTRRHLEP